jgi:uncharacterized membrane protein YhaH (DUF805 family)
LATNQILWLFFSFSGRVSRAAYFLAGLLMMITVVFITYKMILAEQAGRSTGTWESVLSVVLIASLWAQAALGSKRFHDFGKPGLFAALLFVPFFNFITFVALCFIPGNPGPNQYGRVTNAPK